MLYFIRFCESPGTEDIDSRTPKGRGKRGRNGGLQTSGVDRSGGGNGGGGVNVGGVGAGGSGSHANDFSNVTETRSGKVRGGLPVKGRRGAASNSTSSPSNFATPNSPQNSSNKRKGREADISINCDPKNKRSRVCGNRQTNGTDGSNSGTSSISSCNGSPERGTNGEDNTSSTSPPAHSPQLIECPEPNCNKKYKHINGLKYHQSHAHNNNIGDNADCGATNAESDDGLSNSSEDVRNTPSENDSSNTAANTNSSNKGNSNSNINSSNSNNDSDLVKSTVLRYPGQQQQQPQSSQSNASTNNNNSSSSNNTGTITPNNLGQGHSTHPSQQGNPHQPNLIASHSGISNQPQKSQTQQNSPATSQHPPLQSSIGGPPGTPTSQPVFHPQNPGTPYASHPGVPGNSHYPPPTGNGSFTASSPTQVPTSAHSPLTTLSPQQLQSLQCPPPTSEISPPSVIARLPPPTHPMYVYPPNSTPSSPHRSQVSQGSPMPNSPASSIRPQATLRGVVQPGRLPNPTPQMAASPRHSVPPTGPPQSTSLGSLPGTPNSTNNKANKNGRESGGEDDPRSPAYSDISDAADAPPSEGETPNGSVVASDRRDEAPKADSMLLQPPAPSFIGLGVYGGLDGSNPFSGQNPYLVRYPGHPPQMKQDPKDSSKPGDDKRDGGQDPPKFGPGQSPFPTGVYPYGAGLPPHYTSDPYYAHLASGPPPMPGGAPVDPNHPTNKENSGSSAPADKPPNSIASPYRAHAMDPRILHQPLLPHGAMPGLPAPLDKQGQDGGKDAKNDSKSDGPDGLNKGQRGPGDQPPPSSSAPFYPSHPAFPPYSFDAYRLAAAGLPNSHYSPAYLPQQLRFPIPPAAPEDLTRSSASANNTSTPPPSSSASVPPPQQYAPHNLTPHKLMDMHAAAERGGPQLPPGMHQPSPNKQGAP